MPVVDFGQRSLTAILEGVVDFDRRGDKEGKNRQKGWSLDQESKRRIIKLFSAAALLFYPSGQRTQLLRVLKISPTVFRETLAMLSDKGGKESLLLLTELVLAAWKDQTSALPESDLEATRRFYRDFFEALPTKNLATETTGDSPVEIERTKQAITGLIERGIDPDELLIVEVGVGTGRILGPVSQAFPKAEVLGIDILPHQVLKAAGLPENLPFAQGDIVEIDKLITEDLKEGKKLVVIAPWSVVCDVYEQERFLRLWRALKEIANRVIIDVPAGYHSLLQQTALEADLPPFTGPVDFNLPSGSLVKPFLLLPPLAWVGILEERLGLKIENLPAALADKKSLVEKEPPRGAENPWEEPIWLTQAGKPRLSLVIDCQPEETL